MLYFIIECNLEPLAPHIQALGHSALLTTDIEIGLRPGDSDETIANKTIQHEKDLGIKRIIITRDSDFITLSKNYPIQAILLQDKTGLWYVHKFGYKAARSIILAAQQILRTGQTVAYIDCSKFY